MRRLFLFVLLLLSTSTLAQSPKAPDVAPFVTVDSPSFVLQHVRVIDGTGAPAQEDQSVLVVDGKILSIGPSATAQIPKDAKVLNRPGYTVLPGLVGMHNHLFYTNAAAVQSTADHLEQPGFLVAELAFTAPRLYLAAGVTTMRTAGSIEPYTDLKIKHRVDAGLMVGPSIDASAPYIEGPTFVGQVHELTGPDDAKNMVDFWHAQGMTSYKAYMNITRAELSAAIAQAHAHHEKITGHLCSVTWHEAIALGIDNLEHGPVFADTGFVANKQPDICPSGGEATWLHLEISSPQVQQLIQDLVSHHVAVTSTLPVMEASVPGRPPLQSRVITSLSNDAAQNYLTARAGIALDSPMTALMRKEMDFELAFVKAGGLLLNGPDPTGNGGALPGFGDQRGVELLVEAGFTPLEAIQISKQNGAIFLGRENTIGTIAPGKQADLLLVNGDPSRKIADIEKMETVFKAGLGYDSQKLIDSVRGQVGIR
jgi:imidazolonepropionase-like amidohydrolase